MGLILVIFSFLLLLSLLIVIYQELILTNVPVWRSPFFSITLAQISKDTGIGFKINFYFLILFFPSRLGLAIASVIYFTTIILLL
ncbi:MAG: hypothetical protein MGG37_15845 [Trichodesmium sp. MAG_R01]|nr:hypothetical protein [Trichodesmium sp. MAG_R01]